MKMEHVGIGLEGMLVEDEDLHKEINTPFNRVASGVVLYLRASNVTLHFLSEVLWSTPVRACRMSAKITQTLAWSLQVAA